MEKRIEFEFSFNIALGEHLWIYL